MAMRIYKILSKLILAVCLIGTALAIINYFTGFINANIQISGTIVCIASFITTAIATIILENEKVKKGKR